MPPLKRLHPIIDEPALISYYCRNCEKIVNAKSKGGKKRYSFACPECSEDCLYGTARSLIHYLRIKEHTENGERLLQMQQEKIQQLQQKGD